MVEKICRHLIICGILCFNQIIAAESSDQLIRRKRVVNLEPGGDIPLNNGDAPFVVNIRRLFNNKTICVGSILSQHTVITVASCVRALNVSSIKVLIGSKTSYRGKQRDVISKNIHVGNHQRRYDDGIALLTVVPAIVFNRKIGSIQLYQGLLLQGIQVTIFGWGYNRPGPRGTCFRNMLRSITVPIMSHRDCVNSYRGLVVISDNDVCTYDANKRCGHTDVGAPLVVDNQLAGLHVWRTEIPGRISPDVFVMLQSLEYGPWISSNIIQNLVHTPGTK